MTDIRCPRCGSLIGRADGKAQFRCHKARCFAIVNADTVSGQMVMIRYGKGTDVHNANDAFSIADVKQKYDKGYFRNIRF